MATQVEYITLTKVTCCSCGIVFGVDVEYEARLRESHNIFHCPNGHSLCFIRGKSESEKLRAELNAMQGSRDYFENRLKETENSNRSLRGVITKTKRRIGHGVCPRCTRTFTNLADHIKMKHPKFVDEK